MSGETRSVRFIRKTPPYNEGESADFPSARAQALIDAGVAEDPSAPVSDEARAHMTELEALQRAGMTAGSVEVLGAPPTPALPVNPVEPPPPPEPDKPVDGATGKTAPAEPPYTGPTLTHSLSVPDVQQLVPSVNDPAELSDLLVSEEHFPDLPGGRPGAIEAIQARIAEVTAGSHDPA